jgi:hypothetical protein
LASFLSHPLLSNYFSILYTLFGRTFDEHFTSTRINGNLQLFLGRSFQPLQEPSRHSMECPSREILFIYCHSLLQQQTTVNLTRTDSFYVLRLDAFKRILEYSGSMRYIVHVTSISAYPAAYHIIWVSSGGDPLECFPRSLSSSYGIPWSNAFT